MSKSLNKDSIKKYNNESKQPEKHHEKYFHTELFISVGLER